MESIMFETENIFKHYHKDNELNMEYWFDEKNRLRKSIRYHNNGNIFREVYFNEVSQLHNENDVAFKEWDENGALVRSIFYLNNNMLTQNEWDVMK